MTARLGSNFNAQYWPDVETFSDDIPTQPRSYLKEAAETLSSARASIVMSAGAVDSMLKALNLTEGTLNQRIEKAAKDHLITEDMKEWAHDVRLDANDQRYADLEAAPPSIDDARRCLDFARAFAELLFVLPARVQRGKKAAEEASGSDSSKKGGEPGVTGISEGAL